MFDFLAKDELNAVEGELNLVPKLRDAGAVAPERYLSPGARAIYDYRLTHPNESGIELIKEGWHREYWQSEAIRHWELFGRGE